jgi:hypothetical protein
MRAQPLIAVRNVTASSRWYQQVLGCQSGHGGGEYEQLLHEGELVLQLHAWNVEGDQHVHMGSPDIKPVGNGVLLWFETDAFDAAATRARKLKAEVLEEPHENPNSHLRELWLRDPDGYVVVVAGH